MAKTMQEVVEKAVNEATEIVLQKLLLGNDREVLDAVDGDNGKDLTVNKAGDFAQTVFHNQVTSLGNNVTQGAFGFEDTEGTIQSLLYTGGPEDIHTLRTYSNIATILALRSNSGDPTADEREATLALIRTDDESNVELLDLYNNGYHDDQASLGVSYGIRIQKRGNGKYRPFNFEWSDGNGIERGMIFYSPDDAEGARLRMLKPIHVEQLWHSGSSLEVSKAFSRVDADGVVECRNTNFADGVISYDNGADEVSVVSSSIGIESATKQSRGVWRAVLSKGSSPPDLNVDVTPHYPVYDSNGSVSEVPKVGIQQDPDGDNASEVEIRFELKDDTGTKVPVDPENVNLSATLLV